MSFVLARVFLEKEYERTLSEMRECPWWRWRRHRRLVRKQQRIAAFLWETSFPVVHTTKHGRIITDEMLDEWADEAERGYDLDQIVGFGIPDIEYAVDMKDDQD